MIPRNEHSPKTSGVWALVKRQHGVVSREQLLDLGLSVEAIRHRVSAGRLHPIWKGVYAVGRPQVNRRGRWMAAVLTCGPAAALSHESAAALWGFRDGERTLIEVSIPAGSIRRRQAIVAHRRTAEVMKAVTKWCGIR